MTMNDKLESLFRSKPNIWLDGRKLATVAGFYAFRSRVSDLRTQRGLTIENRQRKVGKATVSEYRLIPGQQLGFLQPAPVGCQCHTMELGPCGWCDGPDREVM